MVRGKILHYVERDGDREIHIISSGLVYDVYCVNGKNDSLSYMFGLPKYQSFKDIYYDIDDIFSIAWKNFSLYEGMIDDE